VSQEAMKILNNDNAKVIVIHMGNGVSLCAVDGGKSVDTSMGLTPLEGIPMGTRSGNVDPALIAYLKDNTEMTSDDVLEALNKKSGYLGLSGGFSSDSRDIVDKMETGDDLAKNAFDVQVKRVCDYIGSYYVTLGGLDMLCFTAGIGENAPIVREAIVNRLKAIGITLDPHANEVKGQIQKISSPDSKVPVYVIPTNEEVMIAREVMKHQQ
jgi:acetate kinase